jgi:hypothetical protein
MQNPCNFTSDSNICPPCALTKQTGILRRAFARILGISNPAPKILFFLLDRGFCPHQREVVGGADHAHAPVCNSCSLSPRGLCIGAVSPRQRAPCACETSKLVILRVSPKNPDRWHSQSLDSSGVPSE